MGTHWEEATTDFLHGLDTDDQGGGADTHKPMTVHATVRAGILGPERLIYLAMECRPAGLWVANDVDQLLKAARVRAFS